MKEYIVSSLNNTLAYLLASRKPITVIAQDGSGDYTTVSAAITAGAVSMFIKEGTYVETGDLNLSDKVLFGTSPGLVELQLPADKQIIIENTGTAKTGTETLTADSLQITNADASFAGITASPISTLLDQILTDIDEVTDPNTADLLRRWRGQTTAGAHKTQVAALRSLLHGVTVTHAPTVAGAAIAMSGIDGTILNCIIQGSELYTTGVKIPETTNDICTGNRIENCEFRSIKTAVSVSGATDTRIVGNRITASFDSSVLVAGGSAHTTIARNIFAGSKEYSIGISASSVDTLIEECSFLAPIKDAIHITATSVRTTIRKCNFNDTAATAYAISGASQYVSVSQCTFTGFTEAVHFAASAGYSSCEGSTFTTSTSAAIGISSTAGNTVVKTNKFIHATGAGACVGVSIGNAYGIVSDNTIVNWAKGISTSSDSFSTYTGNTISAEGLAGSVGFDGQGYRSSISGNTIFVDNVGIDTTADEVSIQGNVIQTNSAAGSSGILSSSKDAVISNNTVKAQTGGAGSTGITASGDYTSISGNVLSTWVDGILVSGKFCTIAQNALDLISGTGIHSNDNDNSVTGNTVVAVTGIILFEKNAATGNIVVSANSAITGDANTVITGNLVESAGGDDAISFSANPDFSQVVGNHITTVAGYAVNTNGGLSMIISGNHILPGTAQGIYASSGSNVRITGNRIYSATSAGDAVKFGTATDFDVSDNFISGFAKAIYCSVSCTRTVIHGNSITACATGIDLSKADFFSIITGNTIQDAATGIVADGAAGTIANNSITQCTGTGIEAEATSDGFTISGNVLYSTDASWYAIRARGTRASVVGNIALAADSSNYGIEIGTKSIASANIVAEFATLIVGSTQSTVSNNFLWGSTTCVGISMTSDCTIIGNYIYNDEKCITSGATSVVSGNSLVSSYSSFLVRVGNFSLISANSIVGSAGDCISLTTGAQVTISSNYIRAMADTKYVIIASYCQSLVISSNSIDAQTSAGGIYLTSCVGACISANRLLGGGTTRGIYVSALADASVTGNSIFNFTNCMAASTSEYLKFSGNTCTGISGSGIVLLSSSHHSVISGNLLTDSWTGTGLGIALASSQYSAITGNTITSARGITLDSVSAECLVGSNVIYSNVSICVYSTAVDTVVSGNMLQSFAESTVQISGANATVSGNLILSAGGAYHGIIVSGGRATVTGNSLTAGTTTGAGVGVHISSLPYNTVSGNTIYGFPSAVYASVWDTSISGNSIVTLTTADAVIIDTTATSCVVSMNTINATALAISAGAGSCSIVGNNITAATGVIVFSVTKVSIRTNTISAGTPIDIRASSHYTSVESNSITSTSGSAIQIASSENVSVCANTIVLPNQNVWAVLSTSCGYLVCSKNNVNGTATSHGFYFGTVSYLSVVGNVFRNISKGLLLISCTQFTISSNVSAYDQDTFCSISTSTIGSVNGNVSDYAAVDAFNIQSTATAITGNTAYDAGRYGIALLAPGGFCTCVGNVARACATANLLDTTGSSDTAHNIIL